MKAMINIIQILEFPQHL